MPSSVKPSPARAIRTKRTRKTTMSVRKAILEIAEAQDTHARATVAGAISILQEQALDNIGLAIEWLRSAEARHKDATRMRARAFDDASKAGDFITARHAKEGLFRKR